MTEDYWDSKKSSFKTVFMELSSDDLNKKLHYYRKKCYNNSIPVSDQSEAICICEVAYKILSDRKDKE